MNAPFRIDVPRGVLALLVLITAITFLVASSTSTSAFGAFNSGWDGTSELRQQVSKTGTQTVIVHDTRMYNRVQPQGSVAVILSPDERYDDQEQSRLAQYVRRGGTLVIADDFGPHGNALLSAVGAQARIDGRLLRDVRHNDRMSALPIVPRVTDRQRLHGVDQLTLNYGSAIRPNGATTLVRSSEYSYLDTNRNGEPDAEESLASRPVVTIESVGEGTVITVADPSVMINAMLDKPDNRAFVSAILGSYHRVLFDYSHTGELPPLAFVTVVIKQTPLLQVLVTAFGLGVIGLMLRYPALQTRLSRFRRSRQSLPEQITHDEGEVVRMIRQRYPDWDEERVSRLATSLANDEEFNMLREETLSNE